MYISYLSPLNAIQLFLSFALVIAILIRGSK